MTTMESIYLAIVIATFGIFAGGIGLLSLRQTQTDLQAERRRASGAGHKGEHARLTA